MLFLTDVAQLTGLAARPLDDPPPLHDPTPETGAHYRRHRGARQAVCAEVHPMGIKRRGIAVVAVDHGQGEP